MDGPDGRQGLPHPLAVREECRRQGIGERLAAQGLKALKAQGVSRAARNDRNKALAELIRIDT